ncbi:APC family permease [Microbacterium sp. Bi128]|uniref:APC family permease n=1 Tax=Microbacterium sp. Bi128 TaxID=2821115 RepID=UPI001DEA56B7|nr:APC family permease [Microbacterium sp. Bi128]CAH0326917.1 hypothetical protein SRABI128_05646 [Microbacterium sp. Bi128]
MSALEDALRNPPRIPAVGDSSPLTGLARRRISRLDILAHSVAAIGPSSGALIGTVVAAQIAGRGVWLAVLLAMAVSWTLAQVFGQYGSRIAGSGSLYTFVAHAAGPRVSLAVMCALAIGYGVLAGFGAAQTAEHLVSAVAPPLVHAPPLASLAVLALVAAVIVAIMTRRAQVSTRLTFIAEAAGILLLVILLFVAFAGGSVPTPEHFSLEGVTPSQIVFATAIMTGTMLGWESASALGAEASRPFASVPRAMSWSVLFSGCLYLLVVVGGAGLNPSAASAESGPSAMWFAFSLAGGWAAPVIHAVLALCFLPVALASWTALSRLIFLTGRERTTHEWVGVIDRISQTPRRAILVSIPLVLAAPVTVILGDSPSSTWSGAFSAIGSMALYLSYAIACFCLPVFLRRIGEERRVWTVVAFAGGGGITAVLIADAVLQVASGDGVGLVVFPLVAGVAVAWYAHLRRRRHGRARLGEYDHTVASDLWGEEAG